MEDRQGGEHWPQEEGEVSFNRSRIVGALAVTCAVALGACGSSSHSSGSATGATASKSADVAAAKAAIAPYIAHPSAFPINTPLVKRPAGKKLAYVDNGTPVATLFYTLAQPAAKALGMSLTRIKAGTSADAVAGAFDSVVQGRYDGVFVPAIPPLLWQRSLGELNAKHIPVVTTGVVGGDKAKIAVMQASDNEIDRLGRLGADWVVARNGDKTNVVFYRTPELSFLTTMGKSFTDEVKRLCPDCEARTVDIPAAALGSKAPGLIVDDLQAHPATKSAVFGTSEQAQGLPQALKAAGIDVQMLGMIPDPATLQEIKDGNIDAGLAVDLPVVAWTLIDSLARATTGEKPAAGAVADKPPTMFVTKDNLANIDVSRGWTGYPDFAARFQKLWSAAKGG